MEFAMEGEFHLPSSACDMANPSIREALREKCSGTDCKITKSTQTNTFL
jgi:hypothetical protein